MNTAKSIELPWNLVTKNLHGHALLRKKIYQKISKLEKHLTHFPPDSVHLHIALERHPKKDRFFVALTLRVPSNILRGEKSGPDLIKSFDQVVKAVLRELEALKSKLRRGALWKRRERRAELHEAKATRFAAEPQPAGVGPQTLADTVSTLLQAEHSRLLNYVRRQLRRDELCGDVPHGAIDPRAVVDEVARQALVAPERKPADASYRIWLYRLARSELSARARTLRQQSRETVPLEEPRVLPEEAERAAGYEPEQPLDIIEEKLEPPVVETKELLPDPHTLPPDEELAQRDWIEFLQRMSAEWPKVERDVFALHFLEGFDAGEVAMIEGLQPRDAERLIGQLQLRLRQLTENAATIEARLARPTPSIRRPVPGPATRKEGVL